MNWKLMVSEYVPQSSVAAGRKKEKKNMTMENEVAKNVLPKQ